MAYGLRCRDDNGNITLDITDRLTRYGGQFDTGTSAGSMTIPMLSGGTPWINVQDGDPFGQSTMPPAVSISGNVISWSWPGSSSYPNREVRVVYGVF